MNIRNKMLLPMIAVVLITAIAILTTVVLVFSNYVTNTTGEDINTFANAAQMQYDSLLTRSEENSAMLANDVPLREALFTGEHDAILDAAIQADEAMEVDFMTITDANGTVIAHSQSEVLRELVAKFHTESDTGNMDTDETPYRTALPGVAS